MMLPKIAVVWAALAVCGVQASPCRPTTTSQTSGTASATGTSTVAGSDSASLASVSTGISLSTTLSETLTDSTATTDSALSETVTSLTSTVSTASESTGAATSTGIESASSTGTESATSASASAPTTTTAASSTETSTSATTTTEDAACTTAELFENTSFEDRDEVNGTPVSTPWVLTGDSAQSPGPPGVALDGSYMIRVNIPRGSTDSARLAQSVDGLKTGAEYRIRYHARVPTGQSLGATDNYPVVVTTVDGQGQDNFMLATEGSYL
ncbi:hypothetical protein ACJ41O_008922 [Fusarium nematophilum]